MRALSSGSKAAGFERRLMNVLRKSDILLEVLDARFPAETRNFMAEGKAKWMGKGLVVVLNKADLVAGEKLKKTESKLKKKGFLVAGVSCKNREGKQKLRGAIRAAAQDLGRKTKGRISTRGMVVGIFGYPNTGKSSLINYLGGRKKARTSAQASFTRGEQFARISEGVMLIDTPGVVSFRNKPWQDLVLLNALSPNQLRDRLAAAERVVKFLLENKPSALGGFYGIEAKAGEEPAGVIAKVAVARNRLAKGGQPDLETASRIILQDWQRGRLKI